MNVWTSVARPAPSVAEPAATTSPDGVMAIIVSRAGSTVELENFPVTSCRGTTKYGWSTAPAAR